MGSKLKVVFRQAASGRTWEVRTTDGDQDVIGMIGARDDGAFEYTKFDRLDGFKRGVVDTLDAAQAAFY